MQCHVPEPYTFTHNVDTPLIVGDLPGDVWASKEPVGEPTGCGRIVLSQEQPLIFNFSVFLFFVFYFIGLT